MGVKSKNACERHEVIEFPPVQFLHPPNCARLNAVVTAAAPRASGTPFPARRGKRSPSAGKGQWATGIPLKAPSRLHFPARARPGSRSPHLCGMKRRVERSPGPRSWAGQPPRLLPPVFLSPGPRRPKAKPKRGSHAQEGHDSFKGLQYKHDRRWAKGRGRDGPPVPPSWICTHRDQGLARGSPAGQAEDVPWRRGSL